MNFLKTCVKKISESSGIIKVPNETENIRIVKKMPKEICIYIPEEKRQSIDNVNII